MSDEAVYRTAPATPGLLNIMISNYQPSVLSLCTNLSETDLDRAWYG